VGRCRCSGGGVGGADRVAVGRVESARRRCDTSAGHGQRGCPEACIVHSGWLLCQKRPCLARFSAALVMSAAQPACWARASGELKLLEHKREDDANQDPRHHKHGEDRSAVSCDAVDRRIQLRPALKCCVSATSTRQQDSQIPHVITPAQAATGPWAGHAPCSWSSSAVQSMRRRSATDLSSIALSS